MKMVDRVEGMPPVWLVQGEQDSVVRLGSFFPFVTASPRVKNGKKGDH